ncbi:uncharacterized protein LOC120456584 [Drosophila santomea]|uniref:uncharacterized protein LOC120456584 n=1 Tax=Drosophila santomea TaxID=129105 RepID=UPI0019540DF6|nr:uncharacterized protein LOC120456584 [Drosophila santomea]
MGKKCTPPPRKSVKRLNGKVKGAVTSKGSANRRDMRSTPPMAVYRHPSAMERRTRSYSAFKNFINKFSRENPGKLRVEGVSIWRKMSLPERRLFLRSSTGQLHQNPSIHTQVREEELLSILPIQDNRSRTDNRPSIFDFFVMAIYRAMHLFY